MKVLQYGRDTRYMSLDHKFDHLWNRIGSDHGGLIKYADPDSGYSGDDLDAPLGVMSMLVLFFCPCLFGSEWD